MGKGAGFGFWKDASPDDKPVLYTIGGAIFFIGLAVRYIHLAASQYLPQCTLALDQDAKLTFYTDI